MFVYALCSITVQDLSASQNSSTSINVVSGGMASSNQVPALVADVAPVLLQALLGEFAKTMTANGGFGATGGHGAFLSPPSVTQPNGNGQAPSPNSIVTNAQGAIP